MPEKDFATYEHTEEEIMEVAASALAYIWEGDPLYAPYDLRGLCVFGVIGALRENDELFRGDNPDMTPECKARLAEVENTVDKAVERGMHYYPFGDFQDKSELSKHDYKQLSASRPKSGQARRTGGKIRYEVRRHINQFIDPDAPSRPVASKKSEHSNREGDKE